MSQPINLPLQPDAVFHRTHAAEPMRPAQKQPGGRAGASDGAGDRTGLDGWDRVELSPQGRVLAHAGRLYREGSQGWEELRDWVEVNGAFWEPLPTYPQYRRRRSGESAAGAGPQAQEGRGYWERMDAAEAAALRLRGRLELAPEAKAERTSRAGASQIVDLWV